MVKAFCYKVFVLALFAFAAAIFILPLQESRADLTAVGPVDDVNGFPQWYQDANGVQLTISTDPVLGLADPVIAGNAFSQQIGFGSEAFYFAATATAGICDVENALEAAFATGDAAAGQQMVFARLRIRCDAPVAGTYTVTHPYGTRVFDVVTPGVRSINETVDEVLFQVFPAPIGAISLLVTPTLGPQYLQPFLVAVAPAPPPGFIGSPAVLQTVSGSPTGNNLVRVDGPPGSNLGGPGIDSVETNQFSLSGQLFAATAVVTANPQAVTVPQDTPTAITLTGTAVPPQALTFAIATPPVNGTLGTLDAASGVVTYTPNPGFLGSDSFTFTVSDGVNISAPATVSITVGVSSAPAALTRLRAGGPPLLLSVVRPGLRNDRFVLRGRLTLRSNNNGINPVNEGMAIQIGPRMSVIIPPGSFVDNGPLGFRFIGRRAGVALDVRIVPELSGTRFGIIARGTGANLPPRARVPLRITIGDDTVNRPITAAFTALPR